MKRRSLALLLVKSVFPLILLVWALMSNSDAAFGVRPTRAGGWQGKPLPSEKKQKPAGRNSATDSVQKEREMTAEPVGEERAALEAARKLPLREEIAVPKWDDLAAQTQDQGAVRVIVGLRLAYQPEGALKATREIEAQRLNISRAQENLLNRLTGYRRDSIKKYETLPFLALEVTAEGLEKLRASEEVASIEEDKLLPPTLAESTQIIGATAAWASGFTGNGQTVAILDTGVDKTHSFLSGKVVSEACYSTTSANTVSVCPGGVSSSTSSGSGVNCPPGVSGCDHGTHVAGIAAGKGNSFSGVARDAGVIAVQIFSRNNSQTSCGSSPAPCALAFSSDIVKGLDRVAVLKNSFNIAAVNMSLGSGRFFANCDSDNPSMTAAISNLRSSGIATVISSGNEGYTNSLSFPACISSAISVGSTEDGSLSTTLDAVSSFSNSASILTMLAPGKWINSSVPGEKFVNFAGTSMAAPHVVGAWALLKSAVPNATVQQVSNALTSTGKPISDGRNGITKPRIKVDAAISALSGGSCIYSISPLTQSFSAGGGNGNVAVTTAGNCAWQASSGAAWVSITGGAGGTGPGTVTYSVQANTGTSPRTGTLLIAGQTFVVSQSGTGADPCSTVTPISIGQQVTGSLSSSDCRFSDGSYVDSYGFNAIGGQQIAVSMDSSAFDTYLYLIGPGGNVVAQDDDGGPGVNSRIPADSGFFTLPATGNYVIVANSYFAGATGNYTLTLVGQSNTGGGNTVTLISGVPQGGSITGNFGFATLSTTQYVIEVPNDAGQLVATLDSSRDLDFYVRFGKRIEISNGALVADYRAESLLSTETIAINQLSTPPLRSGTYFIAVVNYTSVSANFTVTASTGAQPTGSPVELAVDDGSLEGDAYYNQGGSSYAVNRITPTSYPATLSAVKIAFKRTSNLPIGKFFSILAGANTDGNADINGTALQRISASVQSLDEYVTYSVPQVTIGSGDFVIGIFITVEGDKIPYSYDSSPPSRRRSYVSTNGFAFSVMDDVGVVGNLSFRAVARVPATCSYSISPTNQSFDSGGGNGTISVATDANCSWAASKSDAFITINSPTGTVSGNGTVAFSIAPNAAATTRSGTIIAAGQTFTITQTGQSCSYSISPANQSVAATGGTGSVSVTAGSGCNWTATSNANWLSVTGGASGSGNGAVNFSAQDNTNAAQRQGTLTIAGQTFTVTQAGLNCNYSLSPQSQNFSASGGQGSVGVTADSGCNWSAASNAAWVLINSGGSGSGSGTVSYSVLANGDSTSRTGTMTVAGQTFTVTQQGVVSTARALRIGAASGAPGSNVVVPVELVSQGDENAMGFSLTFDTNMLSNPQVTLGSDATGSSLNSNFAQSTLGRVGLVVALSAGQTFSPGVRQVVNLTFTISANASASSTQIGFGDQPIAREVSSASASPLQVSYVAGPVTLTQGYEADVAPRPTGSNNGTVTVLDWVQVGRYVAGLDAITAGSEFQRGDCAPKDSRGDGRMSVSDLTQAGRYAAGLDPVVSAGGPTAPTGGLADGEGRAGNDTPGAQSAARGLRIVAGGVERGQNGSVVIVFDTQGGENAIGFSLNFDAAQLRFLSALPGKDAGGATLAVNIHQAAGGRIGLVLALPGGKSFPAGARELVVLNFTAGSDGNQETVAFSFGDQPVARELADVNADILSASFSDGAVTLTRTVASVSAASFAGTSLAPEAITAAFGNNLAATVKIAEGLPLPTQLAGTTVKVKDSAGVERLAPLFFVAPSQVNYLIPAGTAAGAATITITSGDGSISAGIVVIGAVAPGLFSASASGQGIAAATALWVKADGSQVYEEVSRFDPAMGKAVPVPIDLSNPNEQVYLILFGTGFRGRSSLAATTLLIGGVPVGALYAGPQSDFAGLDQINLQLPRTLAGRGEMAISLTVDGKTANAVTITVK